MLCFTRPLRIVFLAALLLPLSGCYLPFVRTEPGTYRSTGGPPEPGARSGVGKQIALYIPNRLVDLLDIVRVSLGPDLSLGFDIRVTKWVQLAAQAGVGAGVVWDGRDQMPVSYAAAATAAIGPFRTGAGSGEAPHIGDWEIGFASASGKFAIDPAEIVDFVLGWAYIDIMKDDYGWSR
ncbi:MAG: hypothetical protein RL885_24665 [Planctomycetota bacterium]